MNADSRINKFVLFSELDGTVKRPRAGSAANGENGFDPSILGALQHGRSVGIKLLHLKMRVRIDEDWSSVVGDCWLGVWRRASRLSAHVSELTGSPIAISFLPAHLRGSW